jgi:thiamine biosynthesis protein ThiI
VGQVASQTLKGIAAVDGASALPVIRPLAAMDKQQITDLAMEIGTYEISIRPYEDCCTVFVPKHPEHKPNAAVITRMEAKQVRILTLCEEAAEGAEKIVIR